MDLPASLENVREFFSKHKFIYFIVSIFFYFVFFHYFFALLLSISGFLVKMNVSLLFSSNPTSSEHSNFLVTTTIFFRIVLEIEFLGVLFISIASLLKSLTQILLSDSADKRIELSFKDTLLRVTESAKSLLFTWFYIRFLKLGYIFVGILVFLPQALNIKIEDLSDLSAFCRTNTILVVLALLATVLYMYLAVVWNLALVVSIREDKSGIEAVGRASELAEEMKLKLAGLFLNIVLGVFYIVIFVIYNQCMATTTQPEANLVRTTMVSLFDGMIAHEVSIWLYYIFLHHKCKKSHEAAMQFDASVEHNASPQHEPLIVELA